MINDSRKLLARKSVRKDFVPMPHELTRVSHELARGYNGPGSKPVYNTETENKVGI